MLQCSILSRRRHNVSQCPDNRNVYWFKSGLGDSSPHIIYTDGDDEKVRGSCVYHLSKLIQNSSDSGTYYCAMATCGEILFGQGTHVETRMYIRFKICIHLYEYITLKQLLCALVPPDVFGSILICSGSSSSSESFDKFQHLHFLGAWGQGWGIVIILRIYISKIAILQEIQKTPLGGHGAWGS